MAASDAGDAVAHSSVTLASGALATDAALGTVRPTASDPESGSCDVALIIHCSESLRGD